MRIYNRIVKLREFVRCNLSATFSEFVDSVGISPIFADLRLVDGCSSRCRSCTVWMRDKSEELTTAEWQEVIRQLKQSGFLDIFFTGGDIFLRDDIFELMEFSAGKGLNVHCVTNGYSLDRQVAENLMRLNLRSISLSLDALGPKFDQIRGVTGGGAKVISALADLKAFHNGRTRIGLAATIMKDTIRTMKEVTQFALNEQLAIMYNLVHFTHYFTNTPFSKCQYELNEEDHEGLNDLVAWLGEMRKEYQNLLPGPAHLAYIRTYFRDYRQRNLPCFKPLLNICIDPNGDVRPCCSMEPAGHAFEDGVKTVTKSTKYLQAVKKALDKSCPGCSCHYNLTLDMNLHSRLKEFFRWFHLTDPN